MDFVSYVTTIHNWDYWNFKPVARSAAGHLSNGAVAGELKTCVPAHGTSTMGDLPRITLRQMGGASMALENHPVRFLELNESFELKSGLINLLPRFHGMPGEDLNAVFCKP
ncbi:hypothetical protein PIB30_065106 [Stylosanthes scabra]|uniref:Uncharacterized protein n=1 Tax=Stylosanthes scabra TaxID=79078 RepID=A0ABU6XM07_9FABA|nr:hypothetical protein [Stylosanthes scabra]